MTTQNDDTVARTILAQLGGTSRLIAMTGAKHILFDTDLVCFKFKGSRKVNHCKITLDASDTYTVEFGLFKKHRSSDGKRRNYAVKASFSGVYADSLVSVFEGTTGLALSL